MTRMTPQSGAPPGKERTGPTTKDRLSTNISHHADSADCTAGTDTIPKQIRRRRAASRRLPVLADGRADPIDPPRRKRRRQPIQVRAIGANTVEFVGCDTAVWSAIDRLDAGFMRSRLGGAWLVPQADADDVMALLEHRGYWLEVTL
jgi:hypothetical protein